MADLTDPFGRRIEYLRVSVTDRCDLRCTYCMPKGFDGFEEPEDWLTFEELERVVAAFTRVGVRRVRLTGGEPLVRKDLPELVARLGALPGDFRGRKVAKVKVGLYESVGDGLNVSMLLEALPELHLRLDANRSWTNAVRFSRRASNGLT